MTTFLFLRLTHDLIELPRPAVRRGEPRIRPFVPTSVPVPPGYPGLPDRDTEPTATHSPQLGFHRLRGEKQCRLTCTGLWTE